MINEICANEALELSDADLEQVNGGGGGLALLVAVAGLALAAAAYELGYVSGQAETRSKNGSSGKKG